MYTLITKEMPAHDEIQSYLPEDTNYDILIVAGPTELLEELASSYDEQEVSVPEQLFEKYSESDMLTEEIQDMLVHAIDNLSISGEEAVSLALRLAEVRFERRMDKLRNDVDSMFD